MYEARRIDNDGKVAIKCLKEDLDTDARRRWYTEVKTSTTIMHENCVRTLESGFSDQGHPYMVMELIEGGTLGDVLPFLSTSKNRSRYDMIVALAAQVLEGLGHAHGLSIIHRDLKPSNILLKQDGDWYMPKIADFGISIIAGEPRATRTGQLVGTPAYWSPEQGKGAAIDTRSDLYSFGVLLYEMLSGRRPFEGRSIDELLHAHCNEKVPPLPEHTPPQLAAIVLRLLEKAPAARQGTAQEVRDELLRWRDIVHATNIPSLSLDPAAALDAASIMASVLKSGTLSAAYKKYLLAIAEIAAESSIEGSFILLAELHANPEIGDLEAAKSWYERAHDAGDTRASFQLALLEVEGPHKQALLGLAAAGGNAQACTMLAERARIRGDVAEQIRWLTRAHELGSTHAALALGHAFMTTGALSKARELFRQAYREGEFRAGVRADFCELVLRLLESRDRDAWAMTRARKMLNSEGLDLNAVLVAEGYEQRDESTALESEARVEARPAAAEPATAPAMPASRVDEAGPREEGVASGTQGPRGVESVRRHVPPPIARRRSAVYPMMGVAACLAAITLLVADWDEPGRDDTSATEPGFSAPTEGEASGTLALSGSRGRAQPQPETAPPVAACRDGRIEGGETCDGDDLGGATCESLGYVGGQLACGSDCTFDKSGCHHHWWSENFDDAQSLGPEWMMSGKKDWKLTSEEVHSPTHSARSGDIEEYQKTSMAVTLEFATPGSVAFWVRTDSEAQCDMLRFFIDDKKEGSWGGRQKEWRQHTFDVAAGTHILRWEYAKDEELSVGRDAAWIDDISTVGGVVQPVQH